MKFFPTQVLLVISCTLMHLSLSAQNVVLDNMDATSILSIHSDSVDFDDMKQLKALWKGKRIILLGEQSHGDGATFAAKVRLIKFLHQEMGFDMVAFESGLYDNYSAYKKIEEGDDGHALRKSILSIWSDTREVDELIKYVVKKANTDMPLQIAGFDLQEDAFFKDEFLSELKKVADLEEVAYQPIEEVLYGDSEYVAINRKDSARFFDAVGQVQAALDRSLESSRDNKHTQMVAQVFKSWLAMVKWEMRTIKKENIKVQNPRDLQMAKNLIFLSQLYPDKKIIGWGASYHFANEVGQYETTALTKEYIEELHKNEKEEDEHAELFDLDSALYGAIPMGKILKNHFGDELYSLAFSSYEGTYGIVGERSYPIPVPPDESLEAQLFRQKHDYALLNYESINDQWVYSSAMGNLPVYAKWGNIFDGLFFIRESYPPAVIAYEDISDNKTSNTYSIYGRVINAKTGAPVPFVNIVVPGTSVGTSSNAQGEFLISRSAGLLSFSSVGFQSDTIKASEGAEVLVKLQPKSYMLSEVLITDKPLSAKDIIKKARKSLNNNYYQEELNQEMFFRITTYIDDSVSFNEEASLMIYGKKGYHSSNSAANHFNGKILQYRNTTGNPHRDKWSGVGSAWLMLTHDIILDKANVLNRTRFFDTEISGIVEFEGNRVYEITFDCKKPSAYTIGYGHPSPEAAHGKIYINTDDYAVVKYEVCVERQPHSFKRQPHMMLNPWHHHLSQTYKKYRGKYYLNHSRKQDISVEVNKETNKSVTVTSNKNLLTTEIITDYIERIDRRIMKIKMGAPVKENPDFWDSHNFIVEESGDDSFYCKGLD